MWYSIYLLSPQLLFSITLDKEAENYRINPNIRACPYKRKMGKGAAHNSNIRACPSVRVENISWKALNLPFFFLFIKACPYIRVNTVL